MNNALLRFASVAAACGVCFPSAAFAASLTVTQQGAVSASVPKGAQRAVFLEASLKAECDRDVTVESVTVKHRGLGEANDLARVYATEGEARLTKTRSLDSSDRAAELRFVPALTVKACSTKRIQIRADFSTEAAAAGEHGLLIESVAADAPVTLSSGKPATVTARPVSTGAIGVSFLDLPRALQFGKNRTFARIRLDADNVANHVLGSITLTNEGKATDDDLRNLRLENARGDVLTDVAPSLDGDTVTLTFDPPLALQHNATVLLQLKGDIAASKKRTIRFVLEEPSDLQAASGAR